jgi:hypothetical protein
MAEERNTGTRPLVVATSRARWEVAPSARSAPTWLCISYGWGRGKHRQRRALFRIGHAQRRPALFTECGGGPSRLFAFWVDSQDGRIWGTSGVSPYTTWTAKFCVTPPGHAWPPGTVAHPTASRITVMTRRLDNKDMCQWDRQGPGGNSSDFNPVGCVIYLLWFDPTGRLRAARTVDDVSDKFPSGSSARFPLRRRCRLSYRRAAEVATVIGRWRWSYCLRQMRGMR